jgi:hypothetical protein
VALLVFVGNRLTGLLVANGWVMSIVPVTAIRIAATLPILHFPLAGFVFALEIDKWDWYWLSAGSKGLEYQLFYQRWDKVMDLATLGVAAAVTLRWQDHIARRLALATFAWRLIGVLLFTALGYKWLMILFPNVFEAVFVLYILFHIVTGRQRMFDGWLEASLVLVALLIPKVVAEYFLHVLNNRPENVIQVPIPNGWIEGLFWSAAMYGSGALTLVWVSWSSRGARTTRDREEDLSAV